MALHDFFSQIIELLSHQSVICQRWISEDEPLEDVPSIHRHDDFEIRIVLSEDHRYIEHLDVIQPCVCHHNLPDAENYHCLSLIFDNKKISCRSMMSEAVWLSSLYLPELHRFLKEETAGSPSFREFSLLLALLLMRSEMTPDSVSDYGQMTPVVHYLEKYYYRHDLFIAKIAQDVGYSPHYLQKVFCRELGCNPKEYLLKIRMEAAARFLREKRYFVKEVAYLCGFSDPHYFANVFRKYYGKTPGRFMEE